jgi:hypothetical protein
MNQAGLTVMTEILAGSASALQGVLLAAQSRDPFRPAKLLHYAAFVIIPQIDGIPTRLVFETNYDGELDAHLDELVKLAGADLDNIYGNCKGYPAASAVAKPQEFKKYLIENSVPSTAFYVALPGRSRVDIDNAIEVYNTATAYLETLCNKPGTSKLNFDDVWEELVAHFKNPVTTPRPIPSPVSQRQLKWRFRLNAVLLSLFAIPLAIVVLPILLLMTRFYEWLESGITFKREYPVNPRVYEYMNLGRQNHMCTLATVKPSRFRAMMIRLGLFATKILASKVFILGHLDTITTIHFARWSLIDNDRHVLFLSNYDGSWSSYIDDFSDPPHLNAVWGNTERFPPTRFMLWQGARLIQQFQAHVVEEFQPAYFFHRPYGDNTVQNLIRYLELRDALARELQAECKWEVGCNV